MALEPTIGVALSGGGNRAALFGLGVLMYLHDAGKHSQVNCISSVSGGSLTNGFIGQECTYPVTSPEEFRRIARLLACKIARQGTVYSWWGVWAYAIVLGASLVGVCALFRMEPSIVGVLLGLASLAIWAQYILGARGAVCARAFGAKLFQTEGGCAPLRAIGHDEIDHVLCATELHSAEHVYFSGKWVYSFRLGAGTPGPLRLQDAVQASASFPVGFPPRWLRASQFEFRGGSQKPAFLVLSDGGVYDNMAEQWVTGASKRLSRANAPRFHVPETLILVNSSSSIEWLSTTWLAFPVIGEILSFLRIVNVLYDNTTAQRRQSLVARFASQGGMPGVFITIEQTPLTVARQLVGDDNELRAARARAVLDQFSQVEQQWTEVRDRSKKVRTTLRALGEEDAANLLYHAYALANANFHVVLGFPLLTTPALAAFQQVVTDEAAISTRTP